jgi:cyclopropane fatty-acyl-phospholipid synthase-like methyltransferase
LVRQTYDRIAVEYNEGRLRESRDSDSLLPLLEKLSPASRVLDLGCGAGVPITRALAQRFEVVGLDFSARQIELARRQVSIARLVIGDISSCEFATGSFDAVVSFFAIFHTRRESHGDLFRRIHRRLKPGGYFLATLSLHSEADYTEPDFYGAEMYWSNFGLDEYRQLLRTTGFELLDYWLLGDDNETHPVVFATRK